MLKRAIGGAALLLSLGAAADEGGRLVAAVPTTSDAWLQLQREGGAASRHPQQATPAERELVLQRWLESFKHPIPEFFEEDVGDSVQR